MADDGQQEITDRVIKLWREYQTELQRHGVTDYAKRLSLEIWQAMRLAPGVDTLPEEKIHLRAFPDAKSRPTRLSRWDVRERPISWSWLSSASPTGGLAVRQMPQMRKQFSCGGNDPAWIRTPRPSCRGHGALLSNAGGHDPRTAPADRERMVDGPRRSTA